MATGVAQQPIQLRIRFSRSSRLSTAPARAFLYLRRSILPGTEPTALE